MIIPQENGRPLPKFGEWDVNDPASAEGYTVIFNKARDEKKTGGKPESPAKANHQTKPPADHGKTQSVRPLDGNMLIVIMLSFCVHMRFSVFNYVFFKRIEKQYGISLRPE